MSPSPSRFALIGAAGFVAPRHLRAMREVGGDLLAALDPHDAVGVLDAHFPEARFFTEFERFDRHLDKLRRRREGADYVAICSPNYLHDAHVRFALRSRAHAICEKPLVLNPWNVDGLADMERETGYRAYAILQLRHHPAIAALKARMARPGAAKREVELTYVTARGRWYQSSWKGDEPKAGGIATNIGIHFFDMLGHVFGPLQSSRVHRRDGTRAAGFLEFAAARVRWFLSIERADLPAGRPAGKTTYRSITVDGEAVEFSDGFEDLHVASYRAILGGGGFGLEDAKPAIALVADIRNAPVRPAGLDGHPALARLGRVSAA